MGIKRYRLFALRMATVATIIIAAILITRTATANAVRGAEREQAETVYRQQEDAIQKLTVALLEQQEQTQKQIAELSRTISELQDRLSEIEFKARGDIALSADLQEHTYWACLRESVPYDHILKIMWNESGFKPVGAVMDANGLYSAGRMQINAINWPRLENMGLDVYDEHDNITAGILLYAELRETYGVGLAPVAYQCGVGKMQRKGITSTEFSRWILEGDLDSVL